jgi:hypothetical protein
MHAPQAAVLGGSVLIGALRTAGGQQGNVLDMLFPFLAAAQPQLKLAAASLAPGLAAALPERQASHHAGRQ